MNRRSFITALGLAPVAGVMAARDAMAAPVGDGALARLVPGEFAVGHTMDWEPLNLSIARIRWQEAREQVERLAAAVCGEDRESVSAQFAEDLTFLQADPEVVS